jgi:hypothetical protein
VARELYESDTREKLIVDSRSVYLLNPPTYYWIVLILEKIHSVEKWKKTSLICISQDTETTNTPISQVIGKKSGPIHMLTTLEHTHHTLHTLHTHHKTRTEQPRRHTR